MSSFKERVISTIKKIPYGKVASYGQIALYVGLPRAARQVGWMLNQSEGNVAIPWWRIVNNRGYLSIKGTKYNSKVIQRKLLLAEGVIVSDEFEIDMATFRFIPDKKFLTDCELPQAYLEMLIERYGL